MLTFYNTWLPFIYLYGIGGVAFLIGMFLILSSKALNITRSSHKRWLAVLIFGFVYYAGIHGTFILMALQN